MTAISAFLLSLLLRLQLPLSSVFLTMILLLRRGSDSPLGGAFGFLTEGGPGGSPLVPRSWEGAFNGSRDNALALMPLCESSHKVQQRMGRQRIRPLMTCIIESINVFRVMSLCVVAFLVRHRDGAGRRCRSMAP